MWERRGKAKTESRLGVRSGGGWYWRWWCGSVVPFWTCKLRYLFNATVVVFKTNEWLVMKAIV